MIQEKPKNSCTQDGPLVTVVTLTYSHFERLFDTVESVLRQVYCGIEYIISDDGSSDFPREELESFVTSNNKYGHSVRIVENIVNVGTVRNANKVCRMASGEYILFLSCGDLFFNNFIVSDVVKRFVETKAKVLVTSRIYFDDDLKPICLLPHFEERTIIERLNTPLEQYKALALSQFYDMASGSAMYYDRRYLDEFGYFDERFTLWEDGPFLEKYLWENTLEFAYDLVSIWYAKGGVSTSDKKLMPRSLVEDTRLFNTVDLMKHYDVFDRREKRKLRYKATRSEAETFFDRLCAYVKYFPEIAFYIGLNRERRLRIADDKRHIEKLLANSNCN